jgi:hypothetical protein
LTFEGTRMIKKQTIKYKNPVYESVIEINPLTSFYNETQLFNGGMTNDVKYLKTTFVNGEYYL